MTKQQLIWANHIERRPGTMDDYIIKEIPRSYGMLKYTGARVLDIGACFGAFGAYAFAKHATSIVCVEPEPANFARLHRNMLALRDKPTDTFRALTLRHGAVVTADYDEATIPLFLSGGSNIGRHSTVIGRGRESIDVRAIPFKTLLADNPTLVKIDCEGSEHALLTEIVDDPWPDSVTQVVVEFDANRLAWRSLSIPKIVNPETGAFPKAKGWKLIHESGFNGSAWNCLGAWVR